MAWDIAVAGTVHLNDITTPHGRRERIHGGSAVYFALAASRYAPVHFHGIVGRDAEKEFRDILTPHPVNLDGMSVSSSPTFLWRAEHDYTLWLAREQPSPAGCDAEWQPHLTVGGATAPVLFLGSMDPRIQATLQQQSRARLVGADSMTNWIGPARDAVEAVAEASDVLFLNRTELAALEPDCGDDWRAGATSLLGRGARLRAVVVKAGPDGAAVVTRSGVVAKPAAAVTAVVDPTGAGDALAGGFLGACAAAERDDDEFFGIALDTGLACAALAISQFGTDALRSGVRRPDLEGSRPSI